MTDRIYDRRKMATAASYPEADLAEFLATYGGWLCPSDLKTLDKARGVLEALSNGRV